MSGIFLSDDFYFGRIHFEKYHYTDNSKGSPMNYIAYMLKGRAEIVSKHSTIKINEGDVFFIPINLPYQSYWHGDNEIEFLANVISSHMGIYNTNPYSDAILPVPHNKYQRFVHMCDFLASRKFLDIKFENNEIKE